MTTKTTKAVIDNKSSQQQQKQTATTKADGNNKNRVLEDGCGVWRQARGATNKEKKNVISEFLCVFSCRSIKIEPKHKI